MCHCKEYCIPEHLHYLPDTCPVLVINDGLIYRRYNKFDKMGVPVVVSDQNLTRFFPLSSENDSWNTSKLSAPEDVLLSESNSNCDAPYYRNSHDAFTVNLEKVILHLQKSTVSGLPLFDFVSLLHKPTTCNYAHFEISHNTKGVPGKNEILTAIRKAIKGAIISTTIY